MYVYKKICNRMFKIIVYGNIITDKEKILERWEEYIGELYGDENRDHEFILQ